MFIFDLDGTLIDSNGVWGEVDVDFLARRGLEPTLEYQEAMGRSIFPIAAHYTRDYYGLEDSAESIMAEWHELAADHYAHTIPMKPGVEEFLRRCSQKGIPMALFTAGVPALCRAALERLGLDHYFSHLIFAQEIGLEKHDPRCFDKLCQLIGVPPEECTLFDDSPSNCATARAAGMTVVGVYDRFYAYRHEEMQAACHRFVSRLDEFEL